MGKRGSQRRRRQTGVPVHGFPLGSPGEVGILSDEPEALMERSWPRRFVYKDAAEAPQT